MHKISLILIFILIVCCVVIDPRPDLNFYDYKKYNPSLETLKINRKYILSEVKQLEKNEWIEWPEKELYGGIKDSWTIIPFFAFGKWSSHKDKYPKICKILKEIKGLKTALLSKMKSKTKLKPHQGWANLSNHILRCHYGISVPNDCDIYVGDSKRTLQNNEIIMFDDSKIHWAENNSDEDRIILIVDVDRPLSITRGKSTVQDSSELKNIVNSL